MCAAGNIIAMRTCRRHVPATLQSQSALILKDQEIKEVGRWSRKRSLAQVASAITLANLANAANLDTGTGSVRRLRLLGMDQLLPGIMRQDE